MNLQCYILFKALCSLSGAVQLKKVGDFGKNDHTLGNSEILKIK